MGSLKTTLDDIEEVLRWDHDRYRFCRQAVYLLWERYVLLLQIASCYWCEDGSRRRRSTAPTMASSKTFTSVRIKVGSEKVETKRRFSSGVKSVGCIQQCSLVSTRYLPSLLATWLISSLILLELKDAVSRWLQPTVCYDLMCQCGRIEHMKKVRDWYRTTSQFLDFPMCK